MARVERELVAEKATALGRAGERLDEALAEVARVAAALDAAVEPSVRERLSGEYEQAWGRAASARLALEIQREAVGLRHHHLVEQRFPEPPRRH
ncbi:MAG: hypothetical protein ACREK6_19900, partial [Candidatus Rokuibacteriota bacterium]